MKKIAGALLMMVGLCGAGAYWVDLMEFTEPEKGFSASGSIWLRYGILAALLALAALASLMATRRPAAMERQNLPLAVTLGLCGTACAAAGGITLAVCVAGSRLSGALLFGILSKNGLIGILELACAWWMFTLCAHWGTGASRAPAGGIALGVPGSALFMVLTLVRFAENYSSIYRFAQTVQTFSALAALLITAVLLRVASFPESRSGRKEYLAGMWAFYLCTCCEVPQGIARFAGGQTTMADLALSILLGLVGVLGAVCALGTLGTSEEA
jgi:hypothetical protein